FHPVPNLGIAVLFLLMLFFFTGYGLLRGGGNGKAALWEIRPLYYLCGMYFLTTQLIRTRHQVRVCIWIIISGLAFRGLLGCWHFFITLHMKVSEVRAILGHEDSLFFVTGFVLLAALVFLGYRGRERMFLAWTALPNLIAFVFNQRRVTFGVLGLCLGLVVVLLPSPQRLRSLRVVIPLAILVAAYTAVFWKSSGALAMPAQKIKSCFVRQEGTADDSSNEWRKQELLNLRATIRASPQGIGFGQKYLVVVPYADIGDFFPLWNYIPHCAIYWIWVKTGFVGFTIFWLFFGVAIVQAMIDYRAMRDPYFKAIALMVMLFIVGQVIVAYYDLQITYYRNMIYLGIAMGLGTVIRRIDKTAAGGPDGR
ncbi:MAG: O-antigen ligase family protein, partial [bacterium]